MNIVIIGAAGGIGSTLCSHFSEQHNLFLGSRDETKLSNLKDNIISDNQCSISTVDVTNFDSIDSFISAAHNYLGSIDCIINCSGSLLLKPAHITSENDLDQIFKTNVYSCFGIMKSSYKFLRTNGGSIILFSSAASKVGLKNHEAIASAKGAISSFVVSAASTYASNNIRINAIAPGLVNTPLTERITSNKASLDYSKKMHALDRIGNPENFIPIIDSLVDQRSNWITGQTFFVDGGLSNIK
ncbi:MAG: oxidoreductase [Candidatus Marinimicrobia bacterium]|nr:oxidoreductase [Candidatus Neomarinimicrobiota bacterium]|tara:strand:- start:587 stop:1315 length:729 start_codon:yes stop_codon:yes gene_type:complete